MKIVIEKKIEAGQYVIRINISEYTQEESKLFNKYGIPKISIAPKRIFHQGSIVNELPLTDLKYDFIFFSEKEAQSFKEDVTGRIKSAVEILKTKTDSFTGEEELVL